MEQNEFILRVESIENISNRDTEFLSDDYSLGISAWDIGMNFMIDQHITYWYPQLIEIGIEEVCEGDMYYGGPMSISEIINTLEDWGFIVEGTEKHANLLKGENIETKIKPFSEEDYETHNKEENFKVHKSTEILITQLEKNLQRAIKEEAFEEAAQIRDEIKFLKGEL